jgi:hypothetical protein
MTIPAPRPSSGLRERWKTWTSQPSRRSTIAALQPAMLPPTIPTWLPATVTTPGYFTAHCQIWGLFESP